MARQPGTTRPGYLLGWAIGIVAGAIMALFHTPRSDEEEYADVVRKRYGDSIEQSKEAYARARDETLARYNRHKAGDFSDM